MSEFSFYVGIDLGNTKQALHVVDPRREVLLKRIVETHEVIAVLRDIIRGASTSCVAVGVEDRNNALVDNLVSEGFAVYVINPFQADKFRARTNAAGAKDDKRDALVLAGALISDIESFRRVDARDDMDERLRILTHEHQRLSEDFRRHANQLSALVGRVALGLLSLCVGADEPWFWSLLERGDLATLRRTKAATFTKLLKVHGKRLVTADDVMRVVSQPHPVASTAVTEVSYTAARRVISQLRLIHVQMKKSEQERNDILNSADGVSILLSMPGIGKKTAATLLAEAGGPLRRGEVDFLRAVTGVAPVSKNSGKSHRVEMRRACNMNLRNAMYHAAFAASRCDERFKACREGHERRGLKGARALRSVGDKMVTTLAAMMKSKTEYRPLATPA